MKWLVRIFKLAVVAVGFYGIAYGMMMALGPAYRRPHMLDILAWHGTVFFVFGMWLNGTLYDRIIRSYWKAQGYTAEASQKRLEELEEHALGGSWLKHGGRE